MGELIMLFIACGLGLAIGYGHGETSGRSNGYSAGFQNGKLAGKEEAQKEAENKIIEEAVKDVCMKVTGFNDIPPEKKEKIIKNLTEILKDTKTKPENKV